METLHNRVSAVNNDVTTSRIAGNVRSQVQERSFELMRFTLTSTHPCQSREKQTGDRSIYPIGILSLHIFFVSIGTKSEISVAM